MKSSEPAGEHHGSVFPVIYATLTVALGLLTLLGWILNWPLLASLGATRIPMAPSTAILLLVYGSALGWRAWAPLSRRAYWGSLAMTGLGMLVVLLLVVLAGLDIHWYVEHFGLKLPAMAGGAPIGHMSVITGLCFLLVNVSFFAVLSPIATRSWSTVLTLGSAGVLLLISFIFLLAYCFGAPLLYGGDFIPPALGTNLAFAMLALALMALGGPVGFLGRLAIVGSRRVFLLVCGLLSAGIITVGYVYFRNDEDKFSAEVERKLTVITALKVSELVQFRQERMGDARILNSNPVISRLVRRAFGPTADAEARRDLQEWFAKYQGNYQYDEVSLLDTQGVVRMSASQSPVTVSAAIKARLPEALRSAQPLFQDFYRFEENQRIYLSLLVPVRDETDGDRPLGVIVMRIDPQSYLYPVIQRWPAPSRSGETVLVQREGNEAVFLNNVRFQKDSALLVRLPLKETKFPAVKAVLGRSGLMAGTDYRGVPVLAFAQVVPDSPWILMAKMDAAEAYGPMWQQFWQVGIIISLLLLSISAGAGVVWRQQRLKTYAKQAAADAARLESDRRYRALFDRANDGIMLFSGDGTLISINESFARMHGYQVEEMMRMNLRDLDASETTRLTLERIARVLAGETLIFEVEHHHKDGHLFTLEVSASLITDEGKSFILAFHRDITARKQLEREQADNLAEADRNRKAMLSAMEDLQRTKIALAAREARYSSMVHSIGDAIVSTDQAGDIVGWNPAAERIFGYSETEILGQPLALLMPDGHRANHTADYGRRVASKVVETSGWRKSGVEFPLNLAISDWQIEGKTFFTAIIRDISEAKRAEAELRKLSRIVEQAPLSVVITDLAGAIEYVNPAFCAVTGYTVDAVLGRNPRVLKSGLTSPDVYRNLWQTLTRGKVWRGEFNNKKKNGELYDEQAVIAPVTDDAGKVTHYVALKQDITAKKAAETALRESEERFRELFDLESDAILVTESGTGRIVQANTAASVVYGYTVAELLTMTNEDISAEPEKTRVTHAIATGQKFGQIVRVSLRLHRKRDGTVFPVDISVRAFGRGGQILAVLVIRDITEQEKIRETLERFNEELEKKVTLRTEELALRNSEIEALLASIPDLVMRLRDDGTVRDFQPAKGATPLGAVLVKMNERSVDDLMGPLTKVALPLGHRALTGKITVTAEAEVTLGGCPMVAEFRVTPIGNDEVVVFARDITERKRLDAAMAAMLEKSQQISEMKSRFISVTSHEFRTPMAAAMASTDLLHNHYDRLAPAKREEIFNRIDFSFHRMTEMLDDVLLLNRIDADRLKVQLAPVDLRDFTSAIVGEVRIGDHDTHLFELHATGDTAYFVTDVVLLRHILSNLLSNAAHYSPAGTVITTYLAVEPGRMLMTVEDHGIGVSEEDRERIFESFERGSNVGTIKGTGLGLDIVRRMTGMLGGTVRLESSVGGGSRFIVELPRAEIPEPAHS